MLRNVSIDFKAHRIKQFEGTEMTTNSHELNIVGNKIQRVSILLSNIACNGDRVSQEAAQDALSILNDAQFKINSLSLPQESTCSRN